MQGDHAIFASATVAADRSQPLRPDAENQLSAFPAVDRSNRHILASLCPLAILNPEVKPSFSPTSPSVHVGRHLIVKGAALVVDLPTRGRQARDADVARLPQPRLDVSRLRNSATRRRGYRWRDGSASAERRSWCIP